MVRRLMMILGLSLAVASFGCSDDEGGDGGNGGTGTGGSAGMGGTGGVPQTIAPACDNTDDLAAIDSGEPSSALSTECGTAAFTDPTFCSPDSTKMNTCYLDGTDTVDGTTLSTECSSCYADLTCCTLVKCSVVADPPSDPPGNCAGPPTPGDACDQCIQRECGPAFASCGADG